MDMLLAGFFLGIITTIFLLGVFITVWVRTRGSFTIGPPEPRP